MIGFVIRILVNSAALYGASWLLPGFIVSGSWKEYLIAGAVLSVLNATVKPFLRLISMPIIILTLGLFALVINAFMLWVVDYIFDFVKITDTYTLILAAIAFGIINMLTSWLTKLID